MGTVVKIRNRVGWTLAYVTLLLNISLTATGQETGRSSPAPARPESSPLAPIVSESAGTPIEVRPPNGDPGPTTAKPSKDLTGFFAIGFIINILALGAFLYWAAGQWRKKR